MSYRQIQSLNELTLVLNECLEEAIEKALDIAVDKLIEFIEKDVYSRGASEWYERTYELADKNNWKINIDHRYNNITVNIHFDESGFTHSSSMLQHGTLNYPIDAQGLMSVLNDPNLMNFDCNLSYWDSYPRGHFWDDFEEWFKNNFYLLVQQEMNM